MTVNTKPVTPTAPAFQYCDKAIDQNKSTCCLLLLCRSSEASLYTIFTRVGVNNSHLSKGANLTPKQRTPEVPEEYLEHCSYSLYSPRLLHNPPSPCPTSYSTCSVLYVLLGAQPPSDKNVTATSGPVREGDGSCAEGEAAVVTAVVG